MPDDLPNEPRRRRPHMARAGLRCLVPLLLLAAGSAGAASDPAALMAEAAAREHGEGGPRDAVRATELYCAAGRLGAPDALYAWGWMVANGRGVPRDDALAWRLFTLAAAGGHAQAAHLARALPPHPELPAPDCLAPDPPLVVDLEPDPWALPDYPAASQPVLRLVERLAPAYDVDPALALAVISVESDFRANAVSPKNAQGLMQLIPETAQRFAVTDPFDPEANVRGGLAYLRELLSRFGGDVRLVAAAYNAGEGAVLRHRGVPPFPETRAYVQRVLACLGQGSDRRNCRKTLQ